jgi:prepilin-type N-terminal cleavage/methylation domain-containing protein
MTKPRLSPFTTNASKSTGFSLIEMLVSLVLVGTLVLIASGFLLPLQLTRTSARESNALSYARSYLELLRASWLSDSAKFQAGTLPDVTGATPLGAVLKIPEGMQATDITISSSQAQSRPTRVCSSPGVCTTPSIITLRSITVKIVIPGVPIPITLETLIARPS